MQVATKLDLKVFKILWPEKEVYTGDYLIREGYENIIWNQHYYDCVRLPVDIVELTDPLFKQTNRVVQIPGESILIWQTSHLDYIEWNRFQDGKYLYEIRGGKFEKQIYIDAPDLITGYKMFIVEFTKRWPEKK